MNKYLLFNDDNISIVEENILGIFSSKIKAEKAKDEANSREGDELYIIRLIENKLYK